MSKRRVRSLPDTEFVPRLQVELNQRLAHLEQERRAIEGALQALERAGPARRSIQQDLTARIVDVLREDPGVRSTMLAVVLGCSANDVADAIRRLERENIAERCGLGWRIRPCSA